MAIANRTFLPYMVFDLKIILREKVMIFMILAVPAFMYAFFAMMFGNSTYGVQGHTYFDEYTPSFTALILLNIALMGIGPVLVIYKEMGFFRRLMVTPLNLLAIWFSAISRSFIIFLIGYAEMVLLGYLIFEKVPNVPMLDLLIGLLISCFCLFSFGFLLGSIFKSAASAFNAGIFIFQPFLLLSGASFPLETFPEFVRMIALIIPMTHVVEVMRLTWQGSLFTYEALLPTIYLLVFGGACAFFARKFFRMTA